ncbi:hypothetical protein BKA61DRAFT_191912 [Leptodontidium sp. MPI-SDFR-AT-0119]|nr:hypothetical protein BKA61DRAFT_191912 [Leptodontidium sp. MPI-SDFR-AT-0119]
MTINPSKSSRFETLPTEISRIIIDRLPLWDVKDLSRTSKSVREACMPFLFRCVEIPFSTDGFNNLKSLINTDARYHIVSFTYVVPELLKAGNILSFMLNKSAGITLTQPLSRTEILDFSCFKYDLLTPDSYVETAKEIYDGGGRADEYPSYMAIYETLHDICEEQRSIVNNGVDLSVLASTFGALPRLTEVGLSFCEAIEDDSSLSPFTLGMTTAEDSYEYHLRVVSDAIQSSRNRGVAINTISLSGFNLPYYHAWEVPELSTLSESLRKLLQSIRVLRLSYSSSPLELLSRCALDTYQLDMCCMVVKCNALEDFLETNKRSLRSIGFHDVTITESSRLGSLSGLSSDILCKMMKVSQSSSCRAADCGCLPFRKEGWRMLLNGDDHPQRSET